MSASMSSPSRERRQSPAVAFRIFRALLEKKYGTDGARERIFVTTDRAKGTLKGFADQAGYQTFVVPDDVGGRFSVLSAVGLLQIAVAGIDLCQLMQGAADARAAYASPSLETNECYRYAALRNILYRKGKTTEILVGYEAYELMFCEWWKQLFGESEGKDKRGIYPASVIFSTDLHSLGQYIQDGRATCLRRCSLSKRLTPPSPFPRIRRILTASTSSLVKKSPT